MSIWRQGRQPSTKAWLKIINTGTEALLKSTFSTLVPYIKSIKELTDAKRFGGCFIVTMLSLHQGGTDTIPGPFGSFAAWDICALGRRCPDRTRHLLLIPLASGIFRLIGAGGLELKVKDGENRLIHPMGVCCPLFQLGRLAPTLSHHPPIPRCPVSPQEEGWREGQV